MKINIALVGFMGAGKTVVARTLAQKLEFNLVSTDEMIIEKEGRPITEIFATSGEQYFRELEKRIVVELSQEKNLVIDCGGGIVLSQENIENLKQNGSIIYLKASADAIFERTKNQTHRPLLNVDDPKAKISELLNFREPFYEKADHVVETSDKSVEQVVDTILKIV